jgi:putative oxidoreductase
VGWKARWVASVLAMFILVDALLAHPFWTAPTAARHGQLLHFLKHLFTLGGLVLLACLYGEASPNPALQGPRDEPVHL